MKRLASGLLAVLLLAPLLQFLGACAPPAATHDEDPVSVVESVADALWEYLLDRDVYLRLAEGLPIEELPQLTLAEVSADASFAATLLSRLARVDLSQLPHQDFLTARVVQRDLEFMVDFEDSYWNELSLAPYISLYTWRQVATVLDDHPLTSPAEAARFHSLLDDYARLLEQHQAKLALQAERGIRLPAPVIPGTIAMLEGFRDQFAAQVPLPDSRVAALDPELRAEFDSGVARRAQQIVAGYDTLIDVLTGEYADQAPSIVGAYQFDGGKAHYRRMARYFTTTELEPEAIHQLGLERVAEINHRMGSIRDEVGFSGSREEFHDLLRSDPRFIAADPQEVEALYRKHIRAMEERIGDYFLTLPRAPYDVRRLTPAEEINSTFGYYQPPNPSSPTGYYNYNGSRLNERSQVTAQSLIFHELLPGHHLQVALQLESDSLHSYRRNAYFGAYTEGWAEYAASLSEEMGLAGDPYDRYGQLIMEIFLATRLVVDTGIGYLGWSLEEARDYMRQQVFQSETQIATETLRYATRPGQALAYRIGYEEIWVLRRRAEERLGDRFDIRQFHAAVLANGSLPLSVLSEHVDWWIAQQGGATD